MVSPDPSRLKRGPCTLSSCRYARESWVCCTLPAGGAPCTSGVAPALRPCPHRGSSSALTQLLSHLSRRVGPAHLSLPMARLLVVTVLLLCARAAHRAARAVWFVNEHTRCIPEDHFGFSISSRPGEAWWRVPDALWACGSPACRVLSPRGGSRNPPPEDPAATRAARGGRMRPGCIAGEAHPSATVPQAPYVAPGQVQLHHARLLAAGWDLERWLVPLIAQRGRPCPRLHSWPFVLQPQEVGRTCASPV